MNCEGNSTASHSTFRMPATRPSSCLVNICWSAWPNSWNTVSTYKQCHESIWLPIKCKPAAWLIHTTRKISHSKSWNTHESLGSEKMWGNDVLRSKLLWRLHTCYWYTQQNMKNIEEIRFGFFSTYRDPKLPRPIHSKYTYTSLLSAPLLSSKEPKSKVM